MGVRFYKTWGFILSLFSIEQENRYIINNSKIEFYSYAPLEDIQAVNTESVGAIDIESGEFIIKIPVNSFEFPNANDFPFFST